MYPIRAFFSDVVFGDDSINTTQARLSSPYQVQMTTDLIDCPFRHDQKRMCVKGDITARFFPSRSKSSIVKVAYFNFRKMKFNFRKMKFKFRKMIFNFRKMKFNFRKMKFNFRKMKFNFRKMKFNFRKMKFNFRKMKFNFRKMKLNFRK